jgi:spermidine synthase
MATVENGGRAKAPGAGDHRLAWLLLNGTVFLSSCCVMVIELVAGRMVARHLGTSIYTWTSVIGVILAGLALGNYVGGRIADRYPARPTLCLLFALASATCVGITIANGLVGDWQSLWRLSWPLRVALHVSLVFFLPAALLGTISPVVARMALGLGRATGHTLGSVYAWGVIGSIVGTFATGFFLISVMGTQRIVWVVATVLALTALAYLPRSRRAWSWAGVVIAAALLANGPWSWAESAGESLSLRPAVDPDVLYSEESRYSHVEVRRHPGTDDLRGLFLDRLLHTRVSMEDPLKDHYGYVSMFVELTHLRPSADRPPSTLTIGGGGYVLSRYLQTTWPGQTHDVVEIDPAVTRASRAALGLPERTGFRILHEDGRVFVNRRAGAVRSGAASPEYDVAYVDAVVDFAVPHQLTTVEFFAGLRTLIAEDGIVLVNLMDMPSNGRLLGAMIRTLEQVFPRVEVFLEGDLSRLAGDSRTTFVVWAGPSEIDSGFDSRAGRSTAQRLDETDRIAFARGAVVLTDEHAAVEQLIAPVVRASASEIAADEILNRGIRAAEHDDLGGLEEACREALLVEPDFPEAHFNLGIALYARRERREAIDHWRRAVRLRPDYPEARHNLGAALYSAGQTRDAIVHLQEAVRGRPNLKAVRDGLGIALAAAGDHQAAVAEFEAALALDPADAAIRQRLTSSRAALEENRPDS